MFRKCISSGVCILVANYFFLRVLCVALHGDDSCTAPLSRFQFAKMWCEGKFTWTNILISFLLPFRVVFLKAGSNLDPPRPALGTRPAKQGGSACGGVLPPNESFRRFLGFGLGVGWWVGKNRKPCGIATSESWQGFQQPTMGKLHSIDGNGRANKRNIVQHLAWYMVSCTLNAIGLKQTRWKKPSWLLQPSARVLKMNFGFIEFGGLVSLNLWKCCAKYLNQPKQTIHNIHIFGYVAVTLVT